MKKLYHWLVGNGTYIATLFFLVFIPLYPKLPVINVIRTWVYIRLEDFLVAFVAGIFVIHHLRRRKLIASYLTWPIVGYWLAGALSVAWSLGFIGGQLAHYFPHLVLLHFFRRIEYMIFFFIAFAALEKKQDRLKFVIWTIAATVLGIFIYGVGQKFLGFPAFLTMNEEFAKGVPLRLPPTARIASTFGGHYDLAAYLVLVIPILGSLVFGLKRWWEKGVFLVLWVLSLVLLLFTASRVSFGVYLVAITTMLIWQKKKLFIVPVVIASMVLLNTVSGASERFYKTFRYSDVIVDLSTGRAVGTLDKLEGGSARVSESESPAEENLPKGSEFVNIPSGNGQDSKQVKTIEYFNTKAMATGSGEIATVSGSFLIQKAFVYDISITTRFQGQWPLAMAAFQRNILFGSGYSTLSVASDGDYLRMLGETGIVGFIAFLGIFIAAFAVFLKKRATLTPVAHAFVVGVFAGIVGLLCNAVLIDVFEASKVAFTLWLLLGIAMALLGGAQTVGEYLNLLKRVLVHNWAMVLYLVIFALAFFGFTYSWYFIGDDFTWIRWAAESRLSDIGSYFTEASGFFYRPIPKLWYLLLYTVFWLKPGPYHFLSIAIYAGVASLLFAILRQQKVRMWLSFVLSGVFLLLSIHHENIYWISGQSSLLAALFLFAGVYAALAAWAGARKWRFVLQVISYLSIFASMLSYDGMLVAPLIVYVLGFSLYGRRRLFDALILGLVPLYWWMRTSANAVMPSGDYAYNLSRLLVNTVGNGLGYIAGILLGPAALEYFEHLRQTWRGNTTALLPWGAGGLVVIIALWYGLRKQLARLSLPWGWLGAFVLSLAAYVGLGGVAERYAFIASGFLLVAAGIVLERVFAGRGFVKKGIVIIVIASLGYWNMGELLRLRADWATASGISEQTVLLLRKQLFPLDAAKTLIFVDMPIRFGRAWVFPMGLYDPLWHMFHLNPYPFTVTNVNTKEEAFAYPVGSTVRETFIFEDFHLRRLEKISKEIEVDTNGNETP